MNVITNRPIYSKPSVSDKTSNFDNEFDNFDNEFDNFDNEFESFNDEFSYCGGCPDCSGTSNFDNEFSNCGGCSKFEGDYSNADDDAKKPSKFKSLVSKLKLPDKATRQANRTARKQRRSERKAKRLDKKPKKNAKKLTIFKKEGGDGTERYLFDLSKLKRGQKKKKDGTVAEVKKENVAVVTNKATGEKVEVDKREISNATGIPEAKLTQPQIEKAVVVNPETKELSIEVPEKLVEMANDGEVYVSTDIQDVMEETKDVDDKSLSKTQKIVLWSVGGVALLLVGYLVYKAVSKAPTK